MENLILIRPNELYAEQILEYKKEFIDHSSSMDGCGSLKTTDDPFKFISDCEKYEKGEDLKENHIPATSLMLLRLTDNKILGMIQIRHELNEGLRLYGGHVGYSIRPTERKKGYGKEMLKKALPFCKGLGLDKILITCIDDNFASEKIIVNSGGVYENSLREEKSDLTFKRFWIDLDEIKSGFLEESAMAVVFCKDKILSIKEKFLEKENLSLPKGHKEFGESLLTTAIRECFEETDCLLDKSNLIATALPYSYNFFWPAKGNITKNVYPFIFKIQKETNLKIKESSTTELKWLYVEDFLSKCTFKNVNDLIKEFSLIK